MTARQLQKKIREIADQIIEKYHPEKIILFGSAAWGRFSSDSDMDFLIIKKNVPERGIDRQYIIDRLIDRCGVALDLLVYKPEEVEERARLGDPFIKEILNKGKVLYGRQKNSRRSLAFDIFQGGSKRCHDGREKNQR